MPARTGLSSISLVLPMRPSPSARSVPRWRSDWPIWLRTCVSFSFGNGAHLLGTGLFGTALLSDRRLVGQHLADLLAARLGDVLRAPQLPERLLGRLEHVDRIGRAERLREHVADAAQLEHRAHATAGDHAGTGRGGAQQDPGSVEPAE